MLNDLGKLPERLGAADRAWQQEKARVAAWRSIPVLLALAAAAIACDAFLRLSPQARLACLAAGATAVAAALLVFRWLGWHRRNPPERIARHLESRDPALGSALINALQLARQSEDASVAPLTRNLAAGAVRDYAERLSPTDLPARAVTGATRRPRRVALAGLAGFALLLAAFYPVTTMVIPRFLDPYGDHPPYAHTRVDIVDPGEEGTNVVYGSKLAVVARWSGHEPRELFLTLVPEGRTNGAVTIPMIRSGDRTFAQEVPDVRDDLELVVHSRTRSFVSHRRLARVLRTPRIEKGYLQIAPPAYTGLPTTERPFDFASASALQGSRVRFRLISNRPLREGTAEILREAPAPEKVPLTLLASNEVAGDFVLARSSRVRFQVTDVEGLVSEISPEGLLTVTYDLPPTVRLLEPNQDGFVAQDFVLKFRAEASDDYGIRTVRLHRGHNGTFLEPETFAPEGVRRDLGGESTVDLAAAGVRPGDRLSFFAEAIDTCPEPHLARTPTVTLEVIGTEEYNDFLREERDIGDLAAKYEELLRKFHDLRDEQERLAQAAREAAKQAAASATNAPSTEALDRLMARQNELNQRLENQARAMEAFVRPNPLYDFEKDLQKELAEAARHIRGSVATNTAALDRIAADTSREDGRRQVAPADLANLEREAREQAERLGAQDAQLAKSVERPLEDLAQLHELMNDFAAFEQLHQAQREIAEQTAAYEKKPWPDRDDQLALRELASREEAVREVLDALPALLRRHAEAAEPKFPKAAASGRRLADALNNARLAPLASQAADRMLEADGPRSAQMARRVEKEMEKLFSECRGNSPGEAGDELDQYLQLTLGGAKNASLDQMKQCRKLGLSPGLFPRFGRGRGAGSGSGYSQSSQPELAVLGNERLAERGPKESSTRPASGPNAGSTDRPGPGAEQASDPSSLVALPRADRQSAAVPTENTSEVYRNVVDEYFKALTRTP